MNYDWAALYERAISALGFTGESGGPISVGVPAEALKILIEKAGVLEYDHQEDRRDG